MAKQASAASAYAAGLESYLAPIVPEGAHIGLGVKTAAIYRSFKQGTMQNTANPLDLSIQGRGFFQITQPDGTIAYTRSGAFQVSADGELVTADGFLIEPAITVPNNATEISVNQSGQVFATIPGQIDPSNLGQLQIANFINEAGLQAIGNNSYLETTASGAPVIGNPDTDEFGSILQGFLENSNVDPVTELTNLIKAQRVYEMISKAITKSDDMLQSLTQSV